MLKPYEVMNMLEIHKLTYSTMFSTDTQAFISVGNQEGLGCLRHLLQNIGLLLQVFQI